MALERAENIINKVETLEQNYDILNELGRGRFAVVKKCVCKKTGTVYAAKVIKKSRSGNHGRSGREQLLLEIDILHQSQHPKLVRLFDVFETRTEMQLVLEFAQGGDLHRHCIEADVARTEKEICYLIRQIVEAVCYLHSLKIVHLDLKPDNILLKEASEIFPEIRLIDFGLSRRLDLPYSQFDIVGTPEYVAPEVLAYEPIDFGSDMWSIGVVTYVLLSGISPFAGDDVMETYANIGMVEYDFDCEEFDDVSDLAMNFIEKLLERRPKDRMTAFEAFEHDWIKQLEQGITAEDVVLAQNLKTSQGIIKSDVIVSENTEKPKLKKQVSIENFDNSSVDESNSSCKSLCGETDDKLHDNKLMEKQKNSLEVNTPLIEINNHTDNDISDDKNIAVIKANNICENLDKKHFPVKSSEIPNTSISKSDVFEVPVEPIDVPISEHVKEAIPVIIDPKTEELHDHPTANTDQFISQNEKSSSEICENEKENHISSEIYSVTSDQHIDDMTSKKCLITEEPIIDDISSKKSSVSEDQKEIHKKILSDDTSVSSKSVTKTPSFSQKKETESDDPKQKTNRLSSKFASMFSPETTFESKNHTDNLIKKERINKFESKLSADTHVSPTPTLTRPFSPSNTNQLLQNVSTSPWITKKKTDFLENKTIHSSAGSPGSPGSRNFKGILEIEKKAPVVTRNVVTQKIPGGIAAKMANKFTNNEEPGRNPIKTSVKLNSSVTSEKHNSDAAKAKIEVNAVNDHSVTNSQEPINSPPIESLKDTAKLNTEEVALGNNKEANMNLLIIKSDNFIPEIPSGSNPTSPVNEKNNSVSTPFEEKIAHKIDLKKVDTFKPPPRSTSPLPRVVSPIQNRVAQFQLKKNVDNHVITSSDRDHPHQKEADDRHSPLPRVSKKSEESRIKLGADHNHPSVKVTEDSHNHPSVKVAEDGHNHPSVKVAEDGHNHPSVNVAEDGHNQPSVKVKEDGHNHPSVKVREDDHNQPSVNITEDGYNHSSVKVTKDGHISPTEDNIKKLVIGPSFNANENKIKMQMGSSGCIQMNFATNNSHGGNEENGDDIETSEDDEMKEGKSFQRTMLKDTKEKSKSLTRRTRGGTGEGSPQAQKKNYRRLYVSKTRTLRVVEPSNCVNNDAAKIMQRVDNDVLKIEFHLKSTDLKLLP
ncbi:serine/threonine-protein kinase dst1 [Hydra vulgaris]|uniref:serine/threonine-protein kinase dst1 n=1 Tax=Hydra vulgaris TaxID=6087 RepID=UPI0002B40F2D|nr:serine/threonine-protein kinase dst1 [Hydra vulgaris]XP_012562672.1 serine/threonine-protein kinase dst1 [Hydra vulgaris]XP_012562673.1 serine/threonine-protein kinase dst1 [Hydra vulgaris]